MNRNDETGKTHFTMLYILVRALDNITYYIVSYLFQT